MTVSPVCQNMIDVYEWKKVVRVRVRIGGKHAGIRSPDRPTSYATAVTIQEKTGQSGAQLTRVVAKSTRSNCR